jgi:hypothetical protein
VFDAIDTRINGLPCGDVPVGMRGDFALPFVSLSNDRRKLLRSEMPHMDGSASDRTPPEAQILMTSAPHFIWSRAASRHSSGPLQTPSIGPTGLLKSL